MRSYTTWSFIALFVVALLVGACADDTQMQEEPAPADTALMEPDTAAVDTAMEGAEEMEMDTEPNQ